MKRIHKILVPVDYSTTSGVAMETALSLANAFNAAVEVFHVWNDAGYVEASVSPEVLESIATKARNHMRAFLADFEAPSGVVIASRVQAGVPWEAIVGLSGEYDLIVMGTHGRS